MTRLVAIACAAASFSCQSESSNYPPEPSHALRIHFPKIIVRGAHADTLTVDDLRQIRDAARKRRDINLPISFVYVEAPNHVRVVTENSRVVNHTFYEFEFTVDRKGREWVIDSHSIKKQQGTVATGNEPEGAILN